MQKSLKHFLLPLKYIPKWHFLLLCLLLLFSSLDGIVNAQLFGTVAKINATNYQEIVVKALLWGFGGYGLVFTAIMLGERLKNKFMQDSFIALKSAYIEQSFYQKKARVNTDTVLNTVLNDTKILEENYFQALFSFIYQVSMAFCSAFYLFYLNIPLALVFIACSLFAMLPTFLMGSQVTASASIWSASNELFVQKFREILAGRTTLLAYGPKPFMTNMKNQLALQEANYKNMNNKAIFAAWVGWLGSIISFMGPIVVGILMIQRGSGLTGPVLVSMLLASDRIIGPLRQAMQQFTLMQTTNEIRTKLLFHADDSFHHQSAITASTFQQLTVKNASVKYADDKIIHYPDIVIPKQAKIFITGPSGSGKTTFLQLLQGYLQANSGSIEVQTSSGSQPPVLDMFATISQESFLIHDTVKQNLTLGHPFTDARCNEVLTSVGLIDELGTAGLDFITGENGTNLSGGQRQRIAIARALLFEKPVILADEITASLDQVAAEKVRTALYQTGLTIIEVAHHYSEETLAKNKFIMYHLSPQNEDDLPSCSVEEELLTQG